MNQTVKEIEIDIEHAREMVKRKESLDRLFKNADFKVVILEGYFKDEAIRLVEALSNPALYEDKYQKALSHSMRSVSELRQFFNKIDHQADMAQRAIEDGREVINEMAASGELQ